MYKRQQQTRWSAWLAEAQTGDMRHYRELLSELVVVIERYLVSRFGRVHFIEDCVQESLIALHEARHTFDPRRPLLPWLFAIVRHRSIDWLRKANRLESARASLAEAIDAVTPDSLQEDSVSGCLAQLGERQRQALTLTKIYGYTIDEAAQRAGVSSSAMKVRVHRALKALRVLLENADDELT